MSLALKSLPLFILGLGQRPVIVLTLSDARTDRILTTEIVGVNKLTLFKEMQR